MGVGQEIKGIAKHSMIYGVGNILQRILPFILLPLYLHYLDASDYGIKEIIAITVDLVGIVISLGITVAMSRFYYEYEEEKDRNEVVSTILITFGAIGLVGALAAATQSGPLSGWLLNSRSMSHYFLIAFTSMWFNAMYGIGCDYLRMKERSKLYVVVTTLRLALAMGLNIYFVAFLELKVLGILLGNLVTSIIFFLLLVIPILFKIGVRFSYVKCKELMKFGLPLIVSELSGFIVHTSDRFFMEHYLTMSATGIYTLGYRMGSTINMFVTSPFTQIWLPRRFAIYKQPHAKETYSRVLTYYLVVSAFIGVWIAIVSRDALLVIGQPEFYDAARIVPIIVLAYIVFGLHYHVNIGIMLAKKTKQFAIINGCNAVLNIALNFLLIPRYGMYGAAVATLFCFVTKVAWTRIVSNRMYPLTFEYGRIAKIAVASAAVFCIGWLIPYPEVFGEYMSDYAAHSGDLRLLGGAFLLLRSCVMLLFIGILYFIGFWLPEEKEYAHGLLNTARARLAGS